MKNTILEYIHLIIAIFDLIVSGFSIWFSIFVYNDTQTEKINIQAKSYSSIFLTKLIPIGVLCKDQASKILTQDEKFYTPRKPNGEWIRFNQANIILAENGIDFYGNKSKVIMSAMENA